MRLSCEVIRESCGAFIVRFDERKGREFLLLEHRFLAADCTDYACGLDVRGIAVIGGEKCSGYPHKSARSRDPQAAQATHTVYRRKPCGTKSSFPIALAQSR